MTRDDDSNLIDEEAIQAINTLIEIAGGDREDELKDKLKEIVDGSNIETGSELKGLIEKGRPRNRNQKNVEKLSEEASNIGGIEEFFSEEEGV